MHHPLLLISILTSLCSHYLASIQLLKEKKSVFPFLRHRSSIYRQINDGDLAFISLNFPTKVVQFPFVALDYFLFILSALLCSFCLSFFDLLSFFIGVRSPFLFVFDAVYIKSNVHFPGGHPATYPQIESKHFSFRHKGKNTFESLQKEDFNKKQFVEGSKHFSSSAQNYKRLLSCSHPIVTKADLTRAFNFIFLSRCCLYPLFASKGAANIIITPRLRTKPQISQ